MKNKKKTKKQKKLTKKVPENTSQYFLFYSEITVTDP